MIGLSFPYLTKDFAQFSRKPWIFIEDRSEKEKCAMESHSPSKYSPKEDNKE